MSDHLDERLFKGLKDAIRTADFSFKNRMNYYTWEFPIILIDYNEWEVKYFHNEREASNYISELCNQWDDSPPEGDQEELILLKFVNEKNTKELSHTYKNSKFHKEIDGERIYICKSFVHCEPELTINIYI